MPNIREYSSRATGQGARTGVDTGALSRGLQPNNMGVSALDRAAGDQAAAGSRIASMAAQSGRAIEEGVNAVAGTAVDMAEQYYSRQEILKNGAKQAEKLAELTGSWNKTRNEADPNDPLVAKRWNETVLMPTLNEMGKGHITAAGQRMSDEFRERMLNTFAMTQEADQRIANVKAAEINVSTLANASAMAAKSDPMMLATVNENVTATIDAYVRNSNFTAAEAAHFEDLKRNTYATNTQAAFVAMADANPAKAREALANGWAAKYITPETRLQLEQYADAQEQAIEVKQRAAVAAQEKADKAAVDVAANDVTVAAINVADGSLNITPKFFDSITQIAQMPGADPSLGRAMWSWGNQALKEQKDGLIPVTDPATYQNFSARAPLAPDDPKRLTLKEVYQAAIDHRLSTKEQAQFTTMLDELAKDPKRRDAEARFAEFLAGFKSSITRANPLTGIVDPAGDQRFYDFSVAMRQQFDVAYKKGTWQDVIMPNSKDYLGQQVQPYQTGNKAALKALTTQTYKTGAEAPGAAPAIPNADARKPGESIEQYLKRKGGG